MSNVIKQWYMELIKEKKGIQIGNQIVYKGFVIIKEKNEYKLLKYATDGFKKVKEYNVEVLKEHGFVKGIDKIIYDKDVKRISYHKKAIEELTNLKTKFDEKTHIENVYDDRSKKTLQNVIKNHVETYYDIKMRITNYRKKWK